MRTYAHLCALMHTYAHLCTLMRTYVLCQRKNIRVNQCISVSQVETPGYFLCHADQFKIDYKKYWKTLLKPKYLAITTAYFGKDNENIKNMYNEIK